jgi:DMSO reductase anchor subunit
MVGQGYFYFSAALAPLFSCVVTVIAIKCERKARDIHNVLLWFTLVFMSVMFSMAPVIYNINIIIAIATHYILPLYVLGAVVGKTAKDMGEMENVKDQLFSEKH